MKDGFHGLNLVGRAMLVVLWVHGTWAADDASTDYEAHGRLSGEEIAYHQVAEYEIVLRGPAAVSLEVGPWAAAMPGLHIDRLDPVVVTLENGEQRVTQVFRLSPFAAAKFTLPPVVVLADGDPVQRLGTIAFGARDLTPEELAEAEHLVAPFSRAEVAGSGIAWPVWLLLLLALALAAGGVAWWYVRRSAINDEDHSPWAQADVALQHLATRLEQREIRGEAFYLEMSNILRDYVAARYGIPVRERSTIELAPCLANETPLDEETRATLITHLRQIDGVKFAQQQPTASEMAREVAALRRFVRDTALRPVSEVEEGPAMERAV